MKPLIRILLTTVCFATLTAASVTGGIAGGSRNGGHGGFDHNPHGGSGNNTANTTGAAKKPTSFAQPKPPVVRDHGDKNTKTTTTTSCSRGPHPTCATVRDHTSGQQGDWHVPPRGTHGPAGGPNSRNPP